MIIVEGIGVHDTDELGFVTQWQKKTHLALALSETPTK